MHGVAAKRLQLLVSQVPLNTPQMSCMLSLRSQQSISVADARVLIEPLEGSGLPTALQQSMLLKVILQVQRPYAPQPRPCLELRPNAPAGSVRPLSCITHERRGARLAH